MFAQALSQTSVASTAEEPQPTLWQVPNAPWEQIQSLIDP